jgi:hypothetical protein
MALGNGVVPSALDGTHLALALERMRKALRLTALTAIVYAVASYFSFVC